MLALVGLGLDDLGERESGLRELTVTEAAPALRVLYGLDVPRQRRSADMTQSELSRLESRSDHLISTLRRYVTALGGELEVTAVFGEHRIKITNV